ncbi:MAG: 5-bromo-4-chloroindolyl phosphate hydrolysis family protein [Rhodobacteraceae bacterium]|nr:5-bromo-4-chloroindolyl phosphate hydrolysis family protein [Paracoccaceae bacterium]
MAVRYSGRFSPGGPGRDDAADTAGTALRRTTGRRLRRLTVFHLVSLLFVLSAFSGPRSGLVPDLAALALLGASGWLTRQGLLAEAAYAERSVARRPAIPRKAFAAVLTGAALVLGGMVPGEGPLVPLALGLAGAVLHLLAFGPDPMRDKGMEGVDAYQQDRVARVVDEAERLLADMTAVAGRLTDRDVAARIDGFVAAARRMCRTVEEDPRDLAAARKWLVVYVSGARDATVKFADLWSRSRDQTARTDYLSLLDDLETNFAARTTALLQDDRTDLDVEISVLRDRLKRDGVPTDPNGS